MSTFREVFEYPFTRIDPVRGDHVDPPSVAVYETLLRKGPNGQVMAGLAEEWMISDDGLTWLLRIRDGARFHSGAPCSSAEVAEALRLCRWAEGLPRQVWYWDPVDAVRLVDDRTIALDLHYPCARLPVLLWGTHTAIMNPTAWRVHADTFGVAEADGTGPYALTHFSVTEVQARRVAPGDGPDLITWLSEPDDDRRAAAMSEPGIDVVRYVHSPAAGWHLSQRHENSQFYLALDFDDERGFGDVDVRRSIDAFVDRDRLLDAALAGRGDARRSPIPLADEFASAYDPASVESLTRDAARNALRSRGWSPGPDGVLSRGDARMEWECVVQDTTTCLAIATELRRQLREEGIAMTLRPEPLFEPFYRAVEARPTAFVSKWLWQDAMEAIMGFSRENCIEPGGANWQGARCPHVDAAYDGFLQARTVEDQREASRLAQEAFMTWLPYIPLVSPLEGVACRDGIRGYELLPGTLYPSYDAVTLGSE